MLFKALSCFALRGIDLSKIERCARLYSRLEIAPIPILAHTPLTAGRCGPALSRW